MPEELLRRIKQNFPDVAGDTYRYIDEGWDHKVLIVDERLVFRFPDDTQYAELLPKEISILKRLRPFVAVTIPSYTHVAPDGSFAGYPIIPGRPLQPEFFNTLTPGEVTSIASQLAGFLSTMHQLIVRGHDFSDVPPSDMANEPPKMPIGMAKNLATELNADELARVDAILAKTHATVAAAPSPVFIHGDIYSRHLFWDQPAGRLGVIDFSDMNRGDPAFDFAELYEYGEAFVRQVYDCYTGPKDDNFLQRAWIYQQWTGVYMLVDYFDHHKTTFAVARQTFDRAR